MFRLSLVVGLAVATVVAVGGAGPAHPGIATDQGVGSTQPAIVEVYPNPVAPGDEGEFVTLRVPAGVDIDAYTLADADARISLSASNRTETAGGKRGGESRRVTFSTAPDRTASLLQTPVQPLAARLEFANSGERLRLLHNGTTVDEVTYEDAPEGDVYSVSSGSWSPLGATDRQPVSARGGTVEAFVLPDAPGRVFDLLDSADERILLAGYTFASSPVVDALRAAHERGVTVEVLVEGGPVGGMSGHSAGALDELVRAGIPVRVVGGTRARYRYHHAKYAVVDDSALVTTENWKPAGVGGKSSRGWGVITRQDRIVEALTATFRADADWVDAIPWQAYDDRSLVTDERARRSYPSTLAPETVSVERTELLVAPDNAEQAISARLDSATESIDVVQVRISDRGMPFLQALLDAARRGVEVRLLLSGAWYVEEENRQLKAWLDDQAATRDLPLEVRIVDPDGAFEKLHAKGIIVDENEVLVGSTNWSNTSVRENREVTLLLEGDAVAGYFSEVFQSDWDRSGPTARSEDSVPVGYLAVVLVVAATVIAGVRRLDFENQDS